MEELHDFEVGTGWFSLGGITDLFPVGKGRPQGLIYELALVGLLLALQGYSQQP